MGSFKGYSETLWLTTCKMFFNESNISFTVFSFIRQKTTKVTRKRTEHFEEERRTKVLLYTVRVRLTSRSSFLFLCPFQLPLRSLVSKNRCNVPLFYYRIIFFFCLFLDVTRTVAWDKVSGVVFWLQTQCRYLTLCETFSRTTTEECSYLSL